MIFCGTKAGAALNPELELYGELDGYMTDVSLKAETTMNLGDMFRQEIFHFVDCIENGHGMPESCRGRRRNDEDSERDL